MSEVDCKTYSVFEIHPWTTPKPSLTSRDHLHGRRRSRCCQEGESPAGTLYLLRLETERLPAPGRGRDGHAAYGGMHLCQVHTLRDDGCELIGGGRPLEPREPMASALDQVFAHPAASIVA